MTAKEHDRIMLLLPWLLNETLAPKQRIQVLNHLAGCELCRQERDRQQQLMQSVQESDEPQTDIRASLQGTWQRIESAEQNRRSLEEAAAVVPGVRGRVFKPKHAIAAGVVLLVLASLLIRPTITGVSEFQTLTNEATIRGERTRLALNFVEPIPAITLREALIETRSDIISGPDEQGTYVVEIMVPVGQAPATYLERIRAVEGVRYARFLED